MQWRQGPELRASLAAHTAAEEGLEAAWARLDPDQTTSSSGLDDGDGADGGDGGDGGESNSTSVETIATPVPLCLFPVHGGVCAISPYQPWALLHVPENSRLRELVRGEGWREDAVVDGEARRQDEAERGEVSEDRSTCSDDDDDGDAGEVETEDELNMDQSAD